MKTFSLLFLIFFALITTGAFGSSGLKINYAAKAWQAINQPKIKPQQVDPEMEVRAKQGWESASLRFIENNGQVVDTEGKPRPEILFTAQAAGAQVYVSATSIHYVFTKVETAKSRVGAPMTSTSDAIQSITTYRFTVELEGADPLANVSKPEALPYFENHYLAHCPAGVVAKSYEKFTVQNVYPGIDWVVYTQGLSLKYDFVLAKGGDASKIRLKVKDASSNLSPSGSLIMSTSLGRVEEQKPVSFQQGHELKTSFKKLGKEVYGFSVAGANPNTPLTIDPSVVWSTYYGGTGFDIGNSCVSDFGGNVYLAGATTSANFPVSGLSYQGVIGGVLDAFIVKLSTTGLPLWSTYYGGSSDEDGLCTLDPQGNLYVSGFTNSVNFPVTASYQNISAGNGDAFLLKLNSSGSRLWATYLGGSGRDQARVCSSDAMGNIYISGFTGSTDFPVRAAFQPTNSGLLDAFLTKFDSNGSLLYSTYFGGSGEDIFWSCSIDASNNIFLAGATSSSNLPISQNPFQAALSGSRDAFLAKFNSTGSLVWSTYYGGTGVDDAIACAADVSGNIYMAGPTGSADFPVSNAFQPGFAGGASDAFLVKFDAQGNRLWATFYGGNDVEDCSSCALDAFGHVYLTGETSSQQFPVTTGAFQTTYGGSNYDSYLVKFDASGQRLWSSYIGGGGLDIGNYCAADGLGNVYLTGSTTSTNFPVSGAFQDTSRGNFDAFLIRLSNCGVVAKPTLTIQGDTVFCASDSMTLIAPTGFSYLWSNRATTQSITVKTAGSYSVRIITNGCGSEVSDPVQVTVNPAPAVPIITPSGPTAFCVGDSVRLSAPSGFRYSWSTSDTSQAIVVKTPGTYSLRILDGSCTSPIASISVGYLPNDTLRLAHNPSAICPSITSGYRYTVLSRSLYPFTWVVEGGSVQSQDSNWVNVLWSTSAMRYSIKVSAITNAVCYIYPDSLSLRFINASTDPLSSCYVPYEELKIPNVITPNDDKVNDVLVIDGIHQFPANKLTIYNRYGVLIASYAPYQNLFTGKDLAAGTYYIVLDTGEGQVYKGWLEVVR